MKKIEAVITRERFPDVDSALREIGVGGLTVTQVRGRGRSKVTVTYFARGKWTYTTEYFDRVIVTVVVADTLVEKIVEAISSSATTKSVGDGKIFISSLESAIDIGTGERGEGALSTRLTPMTPINNQIEGELHRSGWSRPPNCRFLVIDANGRLTCDYRNHNEYAKNLDRIRREVPEELPDLEMAYQRGDRDECSPETCPKLFTRLRNR